MLEPTTFNSGMHRFSTSVAEMTDGRNERPLYHSSSVLSLNNKLLSVTWDDKTVLSQLVAVVIITAMIDKEVNKHESSLSVRVSTNCGWRCTYGVSDLTRAVNGTVHYVILTALCHKLCRHAARRLKRNNNNSSSSTSDGVSIS